MTPRELVVFLPAVGDDHSFWAPQVEALGGAYATALAMLAFDIRANLRCIRRAIG
jgi:hypothetical protein